MTKVLTLLHHGMIVVGLPYSFEGQSRTDEITGCRPMARRRSHDQTAAACHRTMNLPVLVFRAGTLHKSLRN